MKVRVARKELADGFAAGADRKLAEREKFIMRAFEEPDNSADFLDIAEFLNTDIRFYRMAAAYYGGDIDSLDTGDEEDLLVLASAKDISPKLYAKYLREIGPSAKEEKVTHQALKELKRAIADTVVVIQ